MNQPERRRFLIEELLRERNGFHFPNQMAAKIAVETIEEFLEKSGSDIAIIFNVFKDSDREIYRQLLQLQ